MENMDISRFIVALITPFQDGKIDEESLCQLIDYQINNHCLGFFVLGTTGEFHRMNLDMKKQLIRAFFRIKAKLKTPTYVFLGISAKNFNDTLKLIHFSKDYAFDAFVLTPMLCSKDLEEQIQSILEKTERPVMLYNNPGIHDGNLPITFIQKFVDHPQVIGIKDSSGNKAYFSSLLSFASEKFRIYQGAESQLPTDLANNNLYGIVSGTTNIIPDVFYKILLGQEIDRNQNHLLETKKIIKQSDDYIAAIKKLLVKEGVIYSAEVLAV